MPKQNLDGIKQKIAAKPQSPLIKIQYKISAPQILPQSGRGRAAWKVIFRQKYVLPATVFVVMLVAFLAGMNFALKTPKSVAENIPVGQPAESFNITSSTAPAATQPDVYNTPLEVLQSYFQNSQTDQVLDQRKVELKQFLLDHNSPLADVSDTIAQQPHWQLILAISFAESTLGKKCYEFNCSGIGGATNIRSYKSFANWILDFNRLLDQRYNNWTLEEMCGVYVQPCTNNWLKASGQILDELKQDNIN